MNIPSTMQDSLSVITMNIWKIMEIKKSLVKAIVAGIAIGTSITACSSFDAIVGDDEEQAERTAETTEEEGTCGTDWNCPACGMG